MSDAKYLIAFLLPLAAFFGITCQEIWSPAAVYLGFVLIPLIEQFLPARPHNLDTEAEARKERNIFFDVLLYLNLPILYGLLAFHLLTVSQGGLSAFELAGLTLNIGLVIGTVGINVAHELGHRRNKWEQWMAKAMLLPALYMHFFIEHNRGHHLRVGTWEDPATARPGENLYSFWWRSVTRGYLHAWTLEKERLQQQGKPPFHYRNEMIACTLLQTLYLAAIYWIFSWQVLLLAVAAAIVGFLLLETVNYIEHYGLQRQPTASGRIEKVELHHSWNSDHELGRIFLYELTRHADHHYKSIRKYQILRHHDASPQLPHGYPASMLMALVPPLWFRKMNRPLQAWLERYY